ncbi:MFS transporter [SAR202 cluster bacterium AD-804-J14_MRT_500m]|nr:MFS transporter [SAR202 cluster bacterium AD-804-J14_MRT_500m]
MSKLTSKSRFITNRMFYGWWIVVAGGINMAICNGLFFTGIGLFFEPVRNQLGISRKVMSGAFSMTRLESGLFGPLEGWIIQRFGSRNAMGAGVIAFGLGFVIFSMIESTVTLYVSLFVMSLGAGVAGYTSTMTSINSWFHRKRTMAIGVAMMGMGFGGVVFPPILAVSLDGTKFSVPWTQIFIIIEGVGWQTTALWAGIATILVGIPVSRILRSDPEPYGYMPDGVKQIVEPTDSQPSERIFESEVDFTVKEALKTRAFWILSFGHSLALLIISVIMIHTVPYLEEELGYTKFWAGLVMMVLNGANMFGQLMAGPLSDRFPKPAIVVVCIVSQCIALWILASTGNFVIIMASTVVQGIGWGVRAPITTALRGDYFGRKYFAMILGTSNAVIMIGMTIGPILSGWIADVSSYATAFKVIAVFAMLGAILFLFLRNPQPTRKTESNSDTSRR